MYAAENIENLLNNPKKLQALLERKRQRVLEAAKATGLTQTAIARKLGVSQPYISNVFNRKEQLSFDDMFAWIERLNLDCDI